MDLLFATSNKNKVIEIKKVLPKEFNIKSLDDIGFCEEIPENENTIEGNAIFKANYIYKKYNLNVFADDTGLEVDSLNGKPGVHSARYAGISKNSTDNINKLLKKLKNKKNRKARFKTIIALILNSKIYTFEGVIEGIITKKSKGENGFGYDPVFIPSGYTKTFGELSIEEKNSISHRSLAMNKLIDFIS
ncbi:MAG: non-canonical purine NTP diphosphatase [Flavobacteriaceae bacterium]|nr:non-canonical purine NTP diphosphatase [Flavobacteriaceae bacterium]